MSVRYAVLGLLKEEPDYGYRLKRRFDERVGDVWRLNLGQVYQTLQSLESQGLIGHDSTGAEASDDGSSSPRVRFRLTPKGQRTLETWLHRRPTRPQPVRDELLIRLLLLQPERRHEAIDRVVSQERVYKQYLVRLLARKRRIPRRDDDASLVANLGIEAAIAYTYAHLKWLDYCRLKLEGRGDAVLGMDVSDAVASESRRAG